MNLFSLPLMGSLRTGKVPIKLSSAMLLKLILSVKSSKEKTKWNRIQIKWQKLFDFSICSEGRIQTASTRSQSFVRFS